MNNSAVKEKETKMSRSEIKNVMLGQSYGHNSDFDKIVPKLDMSKDLYSKENFDIYVQELFHNGTLLMKTGKDVLDYFKNSNYKELDIRNLKGETINGADSYKDLEVYCAQVLNEDTLLVIMNTKKTFY